MSYSPKREWVKLPKLKMWKFEEEDKSVGYVVVPYKEVAEGIARVYNLSFKKQRLHFGVGYALTENSIILVVYDKRIHQTPPEPSEKFLAWLQEYEKMMEKGEQQ